jgi:hypothetical protein
METNFQIGQKVAVDISYGTKHEGFITKLDSGHPLYDISKVKVSGIADPVSRELVSPLEGWVSIEGLYKAAKDAYSGISFSPEERAEGFVRGCEEELNNDIKDMPAEERGRYIDSYKKYLFAWLSAKSRCLSTMIAGPSNFPVRKAEKANQSEHNRMTDFVEWRERAINAIRSRAIAAAEAAKSPEQRIDERFEKIKSGIECHAQTIIGIDRGENRGCSRPLFVNAIVGTIKTLAKNGESELVGRCLELVAEINESEAAIKPIITKNHSVWALLNKAVENYQKMEDYSSKESKEETINGVRVVRNFQADRLQLFFDGKPAAEMIAKLKKAAFRWSPSQGCWQRQLTLNAISAMRGVLNAANQCV